MQRHHLGTGRRDAACFHVSSSSSYRKLHVLKAAALDCQKPTQQQCYTQQQQKQQQQQQQQQKQQQQKQKQQHKQQQQQQPQLLRDNSTEQQQITMATNELSCLPEGILPHQMPRHVALIMDGNSRWAEAQGLPAWVGHERGVAALKAAVTQARQWGIPAVTVYAFSVENWQRDEAEVAFLMNVFEGALQQQLSDLQANGVQLHFMGDLHRLPASLQQQMAASEVATAHNDQLLLTIAVSYGAQQDMIQAVQQLARLVQAGQLLPEQITQDVISQGLMSSPATAAVGPPDLLIRTSGEQRMSNFMLWECAYTELCFLQCMWPDFDKQQFQAALQQYAQRQRRYGRRSK